MTWARIMTPLAGEPGDDARLAAARVVAAPFGARVTAVYVPLEAGSMTPWISDGVGVDAGVEVAALAAIGQANEQGRARAVSTATASAGVEFIDLGEQPGSGLVYEARLSDAVVFDAEAACGKGRLSDPFRNLLMSEQRPIIVARPSLSAVETVCLAWDGGKEATRAVRTALPLLARARSVTILSAPEATTRDFDPARLADFLAAREVRAKVRSLAGSDAAACILAACVEQSADLLVAGAYGHTRWREVIFGGVTRSLIAEKGGPSLFLSH